MRYTLVCMLGLVMACNETTGTTQQDAAPVTQAAPAGTAVRLVFRPGIPRIVPGHYVVADYWQAVDTAGQPTALPPTGITLGRANSSPVVATSIELSPGFNGYVYVWLGSENQGGHWVEVL